jgi:hypothetical protein
MIHLKKIRAHRAVHLALAASLCVSTSCRASHGSGNNSPAVDPATVVEELLAADREFSADAKSGTILSVLPQMFDDNVVMLHPNGFTRSKDEASAVLRTNPANATSSIEWLPIRGGVSSDGQQGFTQGYMTVRRADGVETSARYLAYWIKRPIGWRVIVYKRAPGGGRDVSTQRLAPALPARGLRIADARGVAQFDAELRRAESAFSDDAQVIGVSAAFRRWGAPDAVNLGSGPAWVQGPENFAAGPDDPNRPAIVWSSDTVLVASTGDLGVSIGRIRVTPRATGDSVPATRIQHFFTIWKRQSPADPWRYVAE